MAVLSRLIDRLDLLTVASDCHQVTHPWDPSCHRAMWAVTPGGFLFCLKTYASFYLLASLLRLASSKGKAKFNWKTFVRDTVRSSMFLTSNMVTYFYASCLLRKLFGCYTWSTYYIAGFMGSLFSITVEQQRRRPMLALYLTNLASESIFYQLRNRGYVSNWPHAQAVIFGVALSALFYFKAKGIKSDMHSVLKHTHGLTKSAFNPESLPSELRQLLTRLRNGYSRTEKCEHEHSCASNVFEKTVQNFGYGLGASIVMALLKSLKNPKKLLTNIFNRKNLQLPLFAALMPFIYQTSNCLLNHYYPFMNKPKQMAICGALSGASMIAYPSTTIAMYVFWKVIERVYNTAHENGLAPKFRHGEILLYGIATGIVIANCVVEPQAVRPGYFNFIRGLTGGYIDTLGRHHLDPFGFASSRLYRAYQPPTSEIFRLTIRKTALALNT